MPNDLSMTSKSIVASLIPRNKTDVLFIVFMIILAVYYQSYISKTAFPLWDGAIYLQNAHDWLNHEPLTASYRPPLISWVIAGVWSVTGEEEWTYAKYIQATFTLGAGIILYGTLRKYKGAPFAFGVTALTMLNSYVFFYSTQILTEGLSLFFLVLSLYFLKTEWKYGPYFAGVAIAFTFAARYPIFLQAFALLLLESGIRRDAKLLMKSLVGLVPVMLFFIFAVYAKAGGFAVAISGDTDLTPFLSPFYIENFIPIFGYAALLGPISLLFRKTLVDRYNYSFFGWFLVALLFWSSISGNQQERFMIQVTPAVYFFAILTIENLWNSRASKAPVFKGISRRVYR